MPGSSQAGSQRINGWHEVRNETHAVAEAHIGHGSPVVYMVYSV